MPATLSPSATTAITAVHTASTMFAMGAMLGRLVAQLKMPRPDAYTAVVGIGPRHPVRPGGHRCKEVVVKVRFGAEVVHHKFRPATTVGRVRLWAGEKLGMAPGDIAEHVLQIAGTTEQPDVDIHIGSITKCPQCEVTFDLVPAHRING